MHGEKSGGLAMMTMIYIIIKNLGIYIPFLYICVKRNKKISYKIKDTIYIIGSFIFIINI